MGPSPILSIIHTVSIGTKLNFNGGNNEYGLENVMCEQTFTVVNNKWSKSTGDNSWKISIWSNKIWSSLTGGL